MQLGKKTTMILMVIGLAGIWGCGHTLRVRHLDPTTKDVTIQVNHQEEETVSFGEEVCFSLSEGLYMIDALSQENKQNIWSVDGKGWELYLEDDAELTLMQPSNRSQKAR